MSTDLVPYRDLEAMAAQVVKSRMFPGITTPEAAMTLFLLCQSEGLHPMQALTRYHVISGRPAMKADAMLAEFMRRGGTVEWVEYTDEKVAAVFTSKGCPSGVTVTWTLADARRAGITGNPTWTKYPRQMLKARVASDGVRMADPAVNQGRWTPEEHESFEEASEVKPAEIVVPEAAGAATNGKDEDLAPLLEASIKHAKAAKPKKAHEPTPTARRGAAAGQAVLQRGGSATEAVQAIAARVASEVRADDEPEYCPTCGEEVYTYPREGKPDIRSCAHGRALWLENYEKTKNKESANRAAAGHFYELQP